MTQAFNLSQLANNVNSSGQLNAATGLYNTSAVGFPTGTLMLFQQTSAPTGWTKQTTHDNKALRVVSGTAGTGGSVVFTTAFGTPSVAGSVSATTLSTSQLASHTHSYTTTPDLAYWAYLSPPCGGVNGGTNLQSRSTGAEGGNGSHTHSLSGASATINVAYVDLIIASKT